MPDRWGSELIRQGRYRDGHQGAPSPLEYLLGVPDPLRLGALRFRDPRTGVFHHAGGPGDSPLKARSMPEVFPAMERFQRGSLGHDEIEPLLGSGASLGGARPKVWVEEEGRQWHAKFPRPHEGEAPDIMAREGVALAVAREAGIPVPGFRLPVFRGRWYVLLTQRFDRGPDNERIPFLSGQGLLGTGHHERASYPELLEALEGFTSGDPMPAREDLFRRALLNVLIGNTDDHLRNHGLLMDPDGVWRWSPVFDLEPRVFGHDESLSTALHWMGDFRASVSLAFESAEEFGLSEEQATGLGEQVLEAIMRWETLAHRLNLDARAVNAMRSCFEHERVRELERWVNDHRPGPRSSPEP
jgi:serine/threonine-protein kinase HipA